MKIHYVVNYKTDTITFEFNRKLLHFMYSSEDNFNYCIDYMVHPTRLYNVSNIAIIYEDEKTGEGQFHIKHLKGD